MVPAVSALLGRTREAVGIGRPSGMERQAIINSLLCC
jgi:hypothetical protein